MNKENRQTLVWDNIPEWAIFALEYGIEEELFLPNEDLEMISRFIGENFPNGYTMSVDWESCTEFNPRPDALYLGGHSQHGRDETLSSVR